MCYIRKSNFGRVKNKYWFLVGSDQRIGFLSGLGQKTAFFSGSGVKIVIFLIGGGEKHLLGVYLCSLQRINEPDKITPQVGSGGRPRAIPNGAHDSRSPA